MTPLGLAAAVMLALGSISTWSTWRARRRLAAQRRSAWGRPIQRSRDMEAVADLYRSSAGAADALDDRTSDDLLVDDVFAWLDRTESRLGQQVLYRRLRSAPHALAAFDALVDCVAVDVDRRERAQLALARLTDPSVYYLHRLAQPSALTPQWWHVVFPIWTGLVVTSLALVFVWPRLLLVAGLGMLVNVAIRIATGRRVSAQIASFRQVGPLLSAAQDLLPVGTDATAALTGTMTDDLAALRRVGAITWWVSRDPVTTNELVFTGLEYLNMFLLADLNALYFCARDLQSRAPALLRVIGAVGEIDAAIAVASMRSGAPYWTRPRFVDAEEPVHLADVYHPLVEEAVPNSITLAPPHGMIVTGSNMSGKSTFLRTVGLNAVLAQTICTCLARRYDAPLYAVRSCIGRRDDLLTGTSYYLAEVGSVVALIRASERPEPQLFLFDELFRGTNATERVAAAEAVLDALVGADKPHVVLVATHDAELVDLLRGKYMVFHLSDSIGPEGLVFDYRLTPGPATSRNAIALLELHGAPSAIVARALARTAALDRRRPRSVVS